MKVGNHGKPGIHELGISETNQPVMVSGSLIILWRAMYEKHNYTANDCNVRYPR